AGVPLFVCHAALAEQGLHSEDAARRARYAFFDALAAQHHALIATAHTLSDNAETLLLRLVRGTSLAGAGGIPVRRGVYIRPLLFCTRAEIETYCAEHALHYVIDATNESDDYARNRVRNRVLPEFCKISSAAQQNLVLFAQEAAQTAAYLNEMAEQLLATHHTAHGTEAAALCAAPPPVRNAALVVLLRPFCAPDRAKIERCNKVLQGDAARAELVRGVFAAVRKGEFLITRDMTAQESIECALEFREYQEFSGHFFEVSLISMTQMIKNCKQSKKELKNCADYGMIKINPVFRTRRTGDVFHPQGRGVGKTLKKLFIEDGIPRALRAEIPVLAAQDTVFWVSGYGFSEDCCPNANTEQVLYIKEDKNMQGEA
ncbi:MAG: tRNA lysidine(34) synthetase TilS, partial [Pygmaiobacter sp.]